VDVDVLVIGAGPAGLAAATHLGAASRCSVLLIDAGRHFTKRPCPVDRHHRCRGCGGICNVISGFGGSIHYGDGVKLSRFPSGRRLYELLGRDVAGELEARTLRLLTTPASAATFRGIALSGRVPFTLKDYPVAMLSTVQVRELVEGLYGQVTGLPNVTLRLRTEARHITRQARGFTVTVAPTGSTGPPQPVSARQVIVAVGRRGQRWWRNQVRELGLDYRVPTPSVGLRFECPTGMLAPGAAIHPDLKMTTTHDGVKVKTFCFCAGPGGGRIKFTDYGDHTLLDGHVVPEPGGAVANFALLAQLRDSAGRPRTHEWIEQHILAPYRRLRTDRPGKPVLQWYPDFQRREVTCATMTAFRQRADFAPSLSDYRMGNVASLLPDEVHTAMRAVFERLMGSLSPGGQFGENARRVGVIGLELESMWDELVLEPTMQTSIPGLYACGDCAGIAQGIVQAAVSGLAAAQDITDVRAGVSESVADAVGSDGP
jgi:uncharacterized protein